MSTLPLPPRIVAAVKALDADGGWDHDRAAWPDSELYRALNDAVNSQYVERSSAYGVECWRLTEEGVALRKALI